MASEMERGELYKGPAGVLRDSNWLSADTIPSDRDTVVEIEAVIRRKEVAFQKETKKNYGSLKFVGKERELGLNATNLRTLCVLFGADTANWYGKKIALFVETVSSFGKQVPAVRIRARKIAPSTPTTPADPKPTDPEPKD